MKSYACAIQFLIKILITGSSSVNAVWLVELRFWNAKLYSGR